MNREKLRMESENYFQLHFMRIVGINDGGEMGKSADFFALILWTKNHTRGDSS